MQSMRLACYAVSIISLAAQCAAETASPKPKPNVDPQSPPQVTPFGPSPHGPGGNLIPGPRELLLKPDPKASNFGEGVTAHADPMAGFNSKDLANPPAQATTAQSPQ